MNAEGVDGIHDGDVLGLADLAHDAQCIVEVALDGHYLRAVHEGLAEFAEGDLARRQEDHAGYAGACGIRGGGSGSIIGRNTFQRPKEAAIEMLNKIIDIYLGKA